MMVGDMWCHVTGHMTIVLTCSIVVVVITVLCTGHVIIM